MGGEGEADCGEPRGAGVIFVTAHVNFGDVVPCRHLNSAHSPLVLVLAPPNAVATAAPTQALERALPPWRLHRHTTECMQR